MFAVGVNSSEKDFLEAFKRPAAIFAGYVGQFLVKPILGYFFGTISVVVFGLPTPIGEIWPALSSQYWYAVLTISESTNQVLELCWYLVLVVHSSQIMLLF